MFSTITINAQTIVQYDIDTVRVYSAGCDTLPVYAYFQVKGKYPESSQTLAELADQALRNLPLSGDLNGYITFRVWIDCNGKLSGIKLLQTNDRYEPCYFPKDAVEPLYAFVKSLDRWKTGKARGKAVNYTGYLSFKIEHSHVVQVSP